MPAPLRVSDESEVIVIRNMGPVDRVVRLVVAAVVLLLGVTGVISGTLLWVLGTVAVIFFLTACTGTCPAYLPFRISTRRKPTPKHAAPGIPPDTKVYR